MATVLQSHMNFPFFSDCFLKSLFFFHTGFVLHRPTHSLLRHSALKIVCTSEDNHEKLPNKDVYVGFSAITLLFCSSLAAVAQQSFCHLSFFAAYTFNSSGHGDDGFQPVDNVYLGSSLSQ